MAFTGNAMCTSFKAQLMTATHNFTFSSGNVFRLALYDDTATLNAATTVYVPPPGQGEVTPSGSYIAGGGTLINVTPSSGGTTAFTSFSDISFTLATITARGALIYNDTAATDPAVCVLDFGTNKTSTAGTFTIVFPAANSTNAIIRIA
jgi:hypothetical protein